MGQAKNRGTREERQKQAEQQAHERKEKYKDLLAAAKEEMNLPEDTEFCGFIVYLPEEDEFLAELKELPDRTLRKFCKIPDFAKCYDDSESAAAEAAKCKQQTTVMHLFDIGSQFIVAEPND